MLNAGFKWILFVFVSFSLISCGSSPESAEQSSLQRNDGSNLLRSRAFDRHPSKINYSRHARCRMGCRGIDENEVKLTLEKGEVNYRKSELEAPDCKRKYALEGPTPDGQRVRIIFAPCANETTVVTVIDLNREKDDPDCICK